MKVKRLIDCNFEEMDSYDAKELKAAILNSEGRVICGQTNSLLMPVVDGVTNAEVVAAFGSDIIMLNSYHTKNIKYNRGIGSIDVKDLKKLTHNLVGVYFECSNTNPGESDFLPVDNEYYKGRIASKENVEKVLEMGANFIVLGGNPGTGVKIDKVISQTKLVKEIVKDEALIMAGKWEDGIDEKVLGDPLATYDPKKVIKDLATAGADVITFPAPGSRHGITVEMIRELVEYSHRLGLATLCFLDSSVEGTDEATIKNIAILMKQTGADIHAIGDAGLQAPENIYTLSVAIRGRRFTFKRMAMRNRDKSDEPVSFF